MFTFPVTMFSAAQAGEWSPLDLSSLYAWWDFSDEGTVTVSSGRVDSISDKSGNGYTLCRVPASGPEYGVVTQNSLNTASFDGNDRRLRTSGNHTFGDFTLFVVYRFTANGNAMRLCDHSYQNGFWLGRQAAAEPTGDGGGIRESSSPFGHYITQGINTWRIIAFGRNGTTKRVYGNNGSTTTATVTSTATTSNQLAIGGEYNAASGLMTGQIAEEVLCNAWLSTSDFNQLGQYLADKWGLSWTDL